MKRLHLALAIAVLGLASSNALAAAATYNFYSGASSANNYMATATSAAGGSGVNGGKGWNDTSSTYYGTNGLNYGNSYSYLGATTGSGPKVTLSAWGSTDKTAGSTISKAFIGDYASGNGFGITSQSAGELNTNHDPDAASPTWQHAIDNTQAYETLMLSFANAVTLNSLTVGFTGASQSAQGDSDISIFAYVGGGLNYLNPEGHTYAQLLANGWVNAGNLMNAAAYSIDNLSTNLKSQYWMVGAYIPVGTNGAADALPDSFKLQGFSATAAVPEPGSMALLGIAGAAMLVGRRRQLARKV